MLNLRQRFAKRRCDGNGRRRHRNNRFALRIERLEQRMMLHHAPWHDGGGGGGDDDDGGGDGETITNPAFVHVQNNSTGKESDDLYLTTADGSTTVALTDTGGSFEHEDPEWSPDGSRIAFLRRTDPGNTCPLELRTIHPDGTNETLITEFCGSGQPLPDTGRGNAFTWSPDGAQIVYTGNGDNEFSPNDLLALDMATGTVNVLVEDLQVAGDAAPLEEAYRATWSPDLDGATDGYQGKILFAGWDGVTTGDGHLYMLDVTIDSGTIKTGDVTVLNDDSGAQDDPAWSPDGQAVTYKEFVDDVGYVIKKMTLDVSGTGLDITVTVTGKEVLLNPRDVNDVSTVGNTALTWSPDSKWIGFMGERPTNRGGSLDLFRIRSDGTDLTNVTPTDKVHELDPDWNPTWTNDIDGALRVAGGVSAESTSGAPLSYGALEPVLQQAANRWSAAGVEDDHPGHLDVRIADLSGAVLGMANEQSGTIWIDRDAAGYGWSVGNSAGGVDLTSVLTHELGHVAGLGHEHQHLHDVMAPTIAPDQRHVVSGKIDVGAIPLAPGAPLHVVDTLTTHHSQQKPREQVVGEVLRGNADLWTPIDKASVAAMAEVHDRIRQVDDQTDDEQEDERDRLFAQWEQESPDALLSLSEV